MSLALKVDPRDFYAAMREYSEHSRRDTAFICNKQTRNVMAWSAKLQKKTRFKYQLGTKSQDPLRNDAAAVTARATKKYGTGFKRSQRAKIWNAGYMRPIGQNYIKSGFAKSAWKIAEASGAKGVAIPKTDQSLTKSKGGGSKASRSWFSRARAWASWATHRDPADRAAKQELVNAALARGLAYVSADMRAEVRRRISASAAKVSYQGKK